jgi:hypothetical protein
MTPPVDEFGGQGTAIRSSAQSATVGTNDTATFTSPFYAEMAPRWALCRDVNLGTEAIRREGANYLLQTPGETDEEFAIRVERTEIFPAFKETVKGLTGMVFRKDPQLQEDVPAKLRLMWENIDGAGTHGAVFARRVFADAMTTGHAGILVDMPVVAEIGAGAQLSIAEESARGIRPYFVHVTAEQIVNWHTEIIGGRVVLTLLVLREVTTEPSGLFATITVTRFRAFRRDKITGVVTFSIWTWGGDESDPELESEGVLKNCRAIPFALVYTGDRLAVLRSLPPLLDLAYTNIAHAQVLSDRRTSIHMSSVPLLVFKGRSRPMPDPNNPAAEEEQIIGPNTGIDVDKDGDVKYVEHAGHALGEAREELRDIEKRMSSQGLAMLQADTRAAETAEAKRIDKAQQDASLSSAARSMQDCIEESLAFAAEFIGEKTGGSCEIDREFESTVMDAPRIAAISAMQIAGQISLRTMWTMLQTGGVLPEELDPELEMARILSEGASTASGDQSPPDGNPDGGTAVDDSALGTPAGDVSGQPETQVSA